MVGIKGAKENQHVNAMKNPNQERWKARMWGRWTLHILKFRARLSSSTNIVLAQNKEGFPSVLVVLASGPVDMIDVFWGF